MRGVWTKVDGRRMYARTWADAAPKDARQVVLVHGLGVSSRYMTPMAVRLASRVRVYAPDLPGSGKSEKPPRVLDVPELADALAAWLEASRIERASFVANSLGCQVTVDLAMRYPERVERLVLVSPTINRHNRSALRQFAAFLLDIPREPLSLLPLALFDYLTSGIFRGLRTLNHALLDRIEEKLPHVEAPALVVCGGRDPLVPDEWAAEVARLLPRGRLVLFPRAAHAVNYNSPDELAAVVLSFLET